MGSDWLMITWIYRRPKSQVIVQRPGEAVGILRVIATAVLTILEKAGI